VRGCQHPLPTPPALTKPRLLVPLHLDSKAEVRQLHRGSFALAGQEKVLRLQGGGREDNHSRGTQF
jgi:hypothetical protein